MPSDGSAGAATNTPAATEPATEPTETTEPTSAYSWWEGDWYGWWCVYSASGVYEDMEDIAWDAYATIDLTGDAAGTVEIWDTETGNGNYLATCGVSFGPGVTEYGCMTSESGTFYGTGTWLDAFAMPSEVLSHADWRVDPGASTVSSFDQMIEISGRYVDPQDDDNWIDYYIFLRPWGMDWEDVRTGDTQACIYDDMMPLYYDDWYLPLLDMGLTQPPATFEDGEALLNGGTSTPTTSDAPAAAPSGAVVEHTVTIDEFMTNKMADFSFAIPESGWVVDVPSRTLYLYNVPTKEDAYSNSPRIQFELKENLDKIDFYKDQFENLKEIAPRTISGIEMAGRTYKQHGMEWIEYYGELPNGIWVTVKISRTSIEPGSEGSAILDSVSIHCD